jgi:hypothetical protein
MWVRSGDETNVSIGTIKTKRRKLLGSSAKEALKILDEMSVDEFARKISTFLIRTAEHHFICYK